MQELRIRADYRESRRRAYPKIEDQLDALWKGGAEEAAMRARIKGIKDKYPKGTDQKPRGKKP